MTADARLIFVEGSGQEARATSIGNFLLHRWLGHLPKRAEIPWRSAEVGAPILSQVMIVSHAEAMAATIATRAEAVRGTDVAIPSDAHVVQFCDQLEVFLATPTPVEYYSAWLIVETADID